MIDAYAGNHSFCDQAAEHAMRSRKDARVFHAQPDQVVDIEEAPVVDLFAGNPPMREPIDLKLQKKMQKIEALRLACASVDVFESALNELLHRSGGLQQLLPFRANLVPNPAALLRLRRICAAVLRQRAQAFEEYAEPGEISGGVG